MKKIIAFALLSVLFFGSCLSLNYYGKKAVFLVDAPSDLVVKNKGKEIEIKSYEAFSQTSGNVKTRYKYPGVLLKVKPNTKVELHAGNRIMTTTVKGNPALGIVIMVFELPFTLGIGTIVDLATTSYFFPKSKYIDVKAILAGTPPRSKKELAKYVQSADYQKIE